MDKKNTARLKGSLTAILLLLIFAVNNYAGETTGMRLRFTDRRVTLMADNYLGLRYFPDEALTGIKGGLKEKFRALIAAGADTYLINGDGIMAIKTAAQVLTPGAAGTYDNGYAGISGSYYDGGKLYAIYHAEDHEGMPALAGGIPGFYCSVGLAVSHDNGETFTKLGQVITSQAPKSYDSYPGQADKGAGEPWCLKSTDSKYLYLYYTDHSRVNNRGVQIFLARCDITEGPPAAGGFFKYYNGSFGEPGIGGLDTPVIDADSMDNSNAIEPWVDYSPYAKKYVMLFGIDDWKEHSLIRAEKSGIYAAYSDDGIKWGQPRQLIRDFAVSMPNKSVSWHAVIIWDSGDKKSGLLVWAYSRNWGNGSNGTSPHFMVGRRVILENAGEKTLYLP